MSSGRSLKGSLSGLFRREAFPGKVFVSKSNLN
jgi:hypothetical protein